MANIVILGAGVSGHTAALHLARKVGGAHRITVVSPNSQWNWIPSNIWVGVDKMDKADVVFPLAPIYAKKGVEFVQGKAVAIWPRGRDHDVRPTVTVELTGPGRIGSEETIGYDYLVNATGPRLKFEMTPGLGPSANSLSVCTADHAAHAAAALDEVIESLRRERRKPWSWVWAMAVAPAKVPPSSTSSTSTTCCERPEFETRPAWSI